nr:MerR family transcriptional regulator [Mammaliicoccus sp. Marseille-Q6498]
MKYYHINEVAKIMDINSSKIRYYEKHNLIQNISRDENNNRLYSEKDIEMINFIICLRRLNMPIRQIKEKLSSFHNNAITLTDILNEHKATLEDTIAIYQNYVDEIENKIENKKETEYLADIAIPN